MEEREGQDMYSCCLIPLTASLPYLPKEKELGETFHPPVHSGIKLEGSSENWGNPSPFFYLKPWPSYTSREEMGHLGAKWGL